MKSAMLGVLAAAAVLASDAGRVPAYHAKGTYSSKSRIGQWRGASEKRNRRSDRRRQIEKRTKKAQRKANR